MITPELRAPMFVDVMQKVVGMYCTFKPSVENLSVAAVYYNFFIFHS
jgi:hypothetical protein